LSLTLNLGSAGSIPRTILAHMAMGKRRCRAKQTSMWVATHDLPRSAAHPFYARLNQILDKHDFDGYVEGLCQRFYADDGQANGSTVKSLCRSIRSAFSC